MNGTSAPPDSVLMVRESLLLLTSAINCVLADQVTAVLTTPEEGSIVRATISPSQ